MGFTEILWSFRLLLEGKTGKEIPELSRLEFLEKFSAKNFVLSVAEDNNSGGFPCSKPLGGSKVDSAFHPYKVDKMSIRNFWGLNGKKWTVS